MPNVRPKIYVTKVNLDTIDKRLMHIMNLDTLHLAEAVSKGPLDKAQSESVRAYLKVSKELKKQVEHEIKDLPDDVLLRITQDET